MSKRVRYNMVSRRGLDGDDRLDRGDYTIFTAELANWLPAEVELVEPSAARRPGVFVEWFDLQSTGGREVLTVCHEMIEWSEDECRAFFEERSMPLANEWSSYDIDEKRWKTMIARLTWFLPKALIEESAEAQLMATVQESHETLMQFVGRFQWKATKLIDDNKIQEARVTLILIAKLPVSLRRQMADVCGHEKKLAPVVAKVVRDQNLEMELAPILVALPKSAVVINDAMQISDLSEDDDEPAIPLTDLRAQLLDGDRIRYDQIKTPEHVIFLAKHLISTDIRWRREMGRFLKSIGSEDTATRPKGDPSGADPRFSTRGTQHGRGRI